MDENNQPRLDQWTDFAGKFLKAEFIDAFPVTLVCFKIDSNFDEDGDAHLFLNVEHKDKKWKWELNKTNQKVVRDLGIKSPLALVSKKITFETIKVRNPSTQQMVNSLAITKIE